MVGAMPNTSPPITDSDSFALVSSIAHAKARCDYGIFLGASANNSHLTPSLASQAFALKMYLEDTYLAVFYLLLFKKKKKGVSHNIFPIFRSDH